MAEVIKFFDPNDKPFGRLSNNYRHNIKLADGKTCATVTNYIYANILRKPLHKQIVCSAKKDVMQTFNKLYEEEFNSKFKKALKKSLQVKFSNPESHISKLLLQTGDARIFYFSYDHFLGTTDPNDSMKGENWYGLALEQTRLDLNNMLKTQKTIIINTEKDEKIYDIYLAHKGLIDAIKKGNNLKEFIGMSITEIIRVLGRENLERMCLPIKQFLENFRKGHSDEIKPFIDYPENLVHVIRKNWITKLQENKQREERKIIFDMYADYLLDRKFPDVPEDKYAEAKSQHFDNPTFQAEAENLEMRLYNLFKAGMLSENLCKDIDHILKSFYIPTDDEVKEAIFYPISWKDKPEDVKKFTKSRNGESVIVLPSELFKDSPFYPNNAKYIPLSPFAFSVPLLKIKNFSYITIAHYILTKLIKFVGHISLKQSYSYILRTADIPKDQKDFLDPDDIIKNFNTIKDNTFFSDMIKYAKEALDKKFEDRYMQDILLITGNSQLIYNDFSEPILGGITNKREKAYNFVGKYLMELRNKFIQIRKQEKFDVLKEEDITNIFEKDRFMNDWIRNRVKDSCNVLNIMKNYLKVKENIRTDLTTEFTSAVLDNIFQPCSQIYGAAHNIKAKVPDYFRQMVLNECTEFKPGRDVQAIEVIWKRLAVIIYYLIKHLKNSGSTIENIRAEIGRVQIFSSTSIHECEKIITGEYDNCIVSAIINILRGIIDFNKKFSKSYEVTVTELDVKTAVSIILKTDPYGILVKKDKKSDYLKDDHEVTSQRFPLYFDEPKDDELTPERKYKPPNKLYRLYKKDIDITDVKPIYVEEGREVLEDEDDEDALGKEGRLIFEHEEEVDPEDVEVVAEEEQDVEFDERDGDENFYSDEEDGLSPRSDLIVVVLRTIDEIKNPEDIADNIEEAVKLIKGWKKMSTHAKRIRINFFATQR
jgi:predicted NAD-dependent protein-ADP-ribosyltransferase YbiA (DUF1768 family)